MNIRLALSAALPAVFAAAVAACSATPGGASAPGTAQPDGSAPVVVTQPGQLALSVQKTRRGASGGKKGLVELAITLSNGEGGAGAYSNPALFKLKGSDGLAVSGGAMPATYVQGATCNPSGEVTAGAAYSCVLTFQLADNADPVELSYANPADVRTAKVAVSLEACAECGAKCTYLDTDKENCGKCGASQAGAQWICTDGKPLCADAVASVCGSECANVQSDPRHCGECGRAVQRNESCQNGSVVCADPTTHAMCGAHCYDITSNDGCGSCGGRCAAAGVTGGSLYEISCSYRTRPVHPCTFGFCVGTAGDCTDAYCRSAGAVAKADVSYSSSCPSGRDYMCSCSDDAT